MSIVWDEFLKDVGNGFFLIPYEPRNHSTCNHFDNTPFHKVLKF